jgi:thiamine biosynthesis lipoprotein
MGTDAHIAIVAECEHLLSTGEARVRELEARWSRFLETSEITALNRHAGQPVLVSPDTIELIYKSIEAWRLTGGRFDPTIAAAIAAHGYDRDFAEVATIVASVAPHGPAPGLRAIRVDPVVNAVTLPAGVSFDPGGIGKGLAADVTARMLVDEGAGGALVNLGGDLRAIGQPPTAEGWVVSVPHPSAPDDELLHVALAEGAIATSSRLHRRWLTTDGEAHHLIDPATGRPAETEVVAVTVVAAEAWWAESLTKALFLSGPDGLEGLEGAHALVVTFDGTVHVTPELRVMLR